MSELLRLQEETKKMLRSVLLPNKEGLLLSGGSQAVLAKHTFKHIYHRSRERVPWHGWLLYSLEKTWPYEPA